MNNILLDLIRRPWAISASQLQKVEQLLQRYPYFQVARLLAARAKQNMRLPDARRTLALASLYTTNRGILRNFLEKKAQPKAEKLPEKQVGAGTFEPTKVPAQLSPEAQVEHLERPTYITDTMGDDERERLIEDTMKEMAILQQTKMKHRQQEDDEDFDSHKKLAKDIHKIASMHQADVKANHDGRNPYAVDAESKSPLSSSSSSSAPPVSNVHSGSPVQVIFGYQQPQGVIPPPAQPSPPPSSPSPHTPPYPYVVPPVPAPPFAVMPPYPYVVPPVPPASAPPFAVTPSYPYVVPPVAPGAAAAPYPYAPPPAPVAPLAPVAPSKPASGASVDLPVQNEQNNIIERFIHNIPKSNPGASDATSAVALNNDEINNEICSEELAELYRNQGHNERAIDIYYRLCDKYPEKSAYFVKKIKEIKRN